MKPTYNFLILFFLFFLPCFLPAQENRLYDGYYIYHWEIPKPPEGDKVQVAKNQGTITVSGSDVTFTLDMKIVNTENPEKDYTFYSLNGTGTASQTGSFAVTAKGNGSCVVYENGREQDNVPFDMELSGTFSVNGDFRFITGKISSVNAEGKIVNTRPLLATYKVESNSDPGDATTRFGSINGQVEVLLPGETEWQDARMEMLMPPGTHIKTAMESTCILGFKDLSTFVLNPESEIIIADIKEDASKIKLVLGKLWTNIKKMARDGKMEVSTTQAVAGIKGTTLVMATDGISTSLKVLEGTVEFTSLNKGSSVSVGTGETVTANAEGLSEKTNFDITAENALWENKTPQGKDAGKESKSSSFSSLISYLLMGAGGLIFIFVILQAFRRKK